MAVALERAGFDQTPAELHGFALGLLLAGVDDARRIWQQELYSELDPADVLAGECRVLLERLFATVFSADDDIAATFALLLPTDIEVNQRSLVAVRDWCQGFLYGFGLGGEQVDRGLSAESREWLRDVGEIGLLDTEGADNDEEGQSALIEIGEYLRAGVMLVREDLKSGQSTNERE
ncbi:MAG: UPF0149 family protein [Gammaproteobacteria bacterium]|nr:UPF0149 family protein [Gammaproteobacteria bacterium]